MGGPAVTEVPEGHEWGGSAVTKTLYSGSH